MSRRGISPYPLLFAFGALVLAGYLALGSGWGCDIKGNISASGERIYHVPGQRYYDATVVWPLRGERWFCSEAEARAAGWRRAKI